MTCTLLYIEPDAPCISTSCNKPLTTLLGAHLCLRQQEDRVLQWQHSMPGVRNVVAGRSRSLRRDNG